MIKLILFDLDGVLIDTKNIHFIALNKALGGEFAITEEEHLSHYDGLKTTQKLNLLTKHKGLPVTLHESISEEKQKYTRDLLTTLRPVEEIQKLFQELEDKGYTIGVCSNAIRRTVLTSLSRVKLLTSLFTCIV